MSSSALRSNLARGFYPERPAPDENALDRMFSGLVGQVQHARRAGLTRFRNIIPATNRCTEQFSSLSPDEFNWQVQAVRRDLRVNGFDVETAARAFALVREVSGRRLEMRHFDVQILGGWILLNGMVAEMQTGEGKTLTATLPAATVALSGVPVHVITVNDYLTQRDAEWMEPVYKALGLTVGTIVQGMSQDDRQRAYACDITYCTNKELVFDYLRDRMDMGRRPGPVQRRVQSLMPVATRSPSLRLRGLYFAIVDEADSVLIDEARTPLIISGQGDNSYEAGIYLQALGFSRQLESGRDYRIDFAKRDVELTRQGRAHLGDLADEEGGLWRGKMRREELVSKALTARHLFQKDKHYVVKDGKVEIVDEYTGRIMPNRSWEGGLHQLVESKEGLEVSARTEVLGRISYQRFFRRYLALSGMTGTAREAAGELWSVYRLKVMTVNTNRPVRRKDMGTQIFPTADAKWAAVVQRIRDLHDNGQPILVGTRTVADSQHLERLLTEAGLPCLVLNALQDQEEARTISQAGQQGQITVATNMAGRGTDIKLAPGMEELGGLHVLATESHDAQRVDRQLFGRCGRQGERGSFDMFSSLEDDLFKGRSGFLLRRMLKGEPGRTSWTGAKLALSRLRQAQRAAERKHYHLRRDLLKMDESLDSALAFSGKGE